MKIFDKLCWLLLYLRSMENRNIKSFVWAWTWTQMRIWEQHRIADLWFNLISGGILPETGKRLQLCAFVKPKVPSSKLLLFTTGAGCTSTRSKSEVCGHWTSSLGIVGIAETWWNSVTASPTRWRWGLYSCGDQVQPGAGVRFDHEQISRKSCTVSKKLWCYSDPIGDPQLFGHDLTGSCLIMFGWKKSCSHFFWMVEPLEIRVNNSIICVNHLSPGAGFLPSTASLWLARWMYGEIQLVGLGLCRQGPVFNTEQAWQTRFFCEVIQKAVVGCWWFMNIYEIYWGMSIILGIQFLTSQTRSWLMVLPWFCHGFAMFCHGLPWFCHGFAMVLPCFAMVLPWFCHVFDLPKWVIINENQGQDDSTNFPCRICWATSDWFWKRVAGMPNGDHQRVVTKTPNVVEG